MIIGIDSCRNISNDRRDIEVITNKKRCTSLSLSLLRSSRRAVHSLTTTTTNNPHRRQVLVDVPRTCPDIALFAQAPIRRMLERVLYIWALRHPGSGYVQGINDVVTPFILVFLDHHLRMAKYEEETASSRTTTAADEEDTASSTHRTVATTTTHTSHVTIRTETTEILRMEYEDPRRPDTDMPPIADGRRDHHDAFTCDVGSVSPAVLRAVEADSYWCLERVLDGVQDRYTPQQPGVQRALFKLKSVISRSDPTLMAHCQEQGVLFEQFAFRWLNCMLLREFRLDMSCRLFDTYIAENNGFDVLHVYVCAALLTKWSDALKKMSFQDMLTFLQDLPTEKWTEKDAADMLAKAYQLMCLYESSPSHLLTSA